MKTCCYCHKEINEGLRLCPFCGRDNHPLMMEKEERKVTFRRDTAEKTVEVLLHKIAFTNRDPEFIYRVKRAVLFGSFVNSDREKIGDLDVAIYLELKDKSVNEAVQNIEKYEEARLWEDTRSLGVVSQLCYGKIEIWKYLKGRSRLIEIHNGDEIERLAVETGCPNYIFSDAYQIIFDEISEQSDREAAMG